MPYVLSKAASNSCSNVKGSLLVHVCRVFCRQQLAKGSDKNRVPGLTLKAWDHPMPQKLNNIVDCSQLLKHLGLQ